MDAAIGRLDMGWTGPAIAAPAKDPDVLFIDAVITGDLARRVQCRNATAEYGDDIGHLAFDPGIDLGEIANRCHVAGFAKNGKTQALVEQTLTWRNGAAGP